MGKLNDVLIRGIVDELSKKIKGGVRLSSLEKGMVINAMKKQSPYKPKEYEDKFYACKCGNVVLMKWEKYPDVLTPKSEGLPYCLACGQRLDWSEEDETNVDAVEVVRCKDCKYSSVETKWRREENETD